MCVAETTTTGPTKKETNMNTQNDTVTSTATSTETAETTVAANPVGRPRKITDKQIAYATSLYVDKGWTVAQIAKQKPFANLTPATLRYHLAGKSPKADPSDAVEMRPPGRRGVSTEQLGFLVSKYQDGATISEIRKMPEMRTKSAGKVRMFAPATLSKALLEAGVTPRRGRPAKEVVDEPEVAAETPEVEVAAEAAAS